MKNDMDLGSFSMKESFAQKQDDKKVDEDKNKKKKSKANNKKENKTKDKKQEQDNTQEAAAQITKAAPKPIDMPIEEYLRALGEVRRGKSIQELMEEEKKRLLNKDKLFTLQNLQHMGLKINEINLYFENIVTDNTKLYKLKKGIVLNNTKNINTVQELIELLGIDQRYKLEQEGLTIQLIDKYFTAVKTSEAKTKYILKENYIGYKVIPFGTNLILVLIGRNSQNEMIKEKVIIYKDGTFSKPVTIRFSKNRKPQNTVVKNVGTLIYPYSAEDLIQKYGFESFEITKYFDKNFDTNNPRFKMKSSIIFKVQNNKKNIGAIEELIEHAGVNQRNKLKESGLTIDLINTYFRTLPNEEGIIEYRLIKDYDSYEIHNDDGNKILELSRKNEQGDTIIDKIIIYQDGTCSEISTINFTQIQKDIRSNFRLFK